MPASRISHGRTVSKGSPEQAGRELPPASNPLPSSAMVTISSRPVLLEGQVHALGGVVGVAVQHGIDHSPRAPPWKSRPACPRRIPPARPPGRPSVRPCSRYPAWIPSCTKRVVERSSMAHFALVCPLRSLAGPNPQDGAVCLFCEIFVNASVGRQRSARCGEIALLPGRPRAGRIMSRIGRGCDPDAQPCPLQA